MLCKFFFAYLQNVCNKHVLVYVCHTRPIHEAHIDDVLSASIPVRDVFGRSSDSPPRRKRLPSLGLLGFLGLTTLGKWLSCSRPI